MKKEKILVVCGPTSTGKSDYAVALAKKLGGSAVAEIISADSRQVYKGMDIGSGKITQREMRGIPHHLLDVADPKRSYSVVRFQQQAAKAIKDIIKRGKTPIICGGTGLYIDAVVYGTAFPAVQPNAELRKKLQKESAASLARQLQTLDYRRFQTLETNHELNNKVRLIRAIEIATALGTVPPVVRTPQYDVEWIYLDLPDDVLKQRIHDRLMKRMKRGMLAEVRALHQQHGVSWKRLESFGLEYRYCAQFLQGTITKETMLASIESDSWHYAKRQRTWFKKYAR